MWSSQRGSLWWTLGLVQYGWLSMPRASMNATDFIVFNKPDLGEEEIEAVSNVIRSGWIGTGKVASQFEEEFADFIGSGYAVAVGSCSVGLQLALKASNIPRGFEVLTTPLTFAATLNAVLAVGLDVRFVDT